MAMPATATASRARRGSRSRAGAVRPRVTKSRSTASQKRPSRMVVGSRPRLMRAVPMGAATLKQRVERKAEDQPAKADEGRWTEDEGRRMGRQEAREAGGRRKAEGR